MNVSSYNTRDLQNFRSLLAVAIEENRDLHALAATVNTELDSRLQMMEVVTPTPASSRRPDNIAVCSICGKPAVIMPLTGSDWTADATHAVQCQNRPAMDKPWLLQHCGHTEYIVLGDR